VLTQALLGIGWDVLDGVLNQFPIVRVAWLDTTAILAIINQYDLGAILPVDGFRHALLSWAAVLALKVAMLVWKWIRTAGAP
jgi:hypothetical protein